MSLKLSKNFWIAFFCIAMTLFFGNLYVYFMTAGKNGVVELVISFITIGIYGYLFWSVANAKKKLFIWELFFKALIFNLLHLWIISILMYVTHWPYRTNYFQMIFEGATSMFLFLILLAWPYWFPVTLFCFLCLLWMEGGWAYSDTSE